MQWFSNQTRVIIAFAVIYFVWGSTFFAVQLGLKSFPPFLFAALRLLIAGSGLAVVSMIRREQVPALSEIVKHSLAGFVIFIGGIVSVVWAQQFISSSLASAIITTPFWFILLDKPQWKFYFSSKWIIGGLLLSMLGVIILSSMKSPQHLNTSASTQTLATLAIVFGSGLWVAGSLFLRYRPSNISLYASTSIQFLASGIVTMILSLVTGEVSSLSMDSVQFSGVAAVVYLGVFSSMIGFVSFMYLIQRMPPAIVSTYAYVNPIVATLLGWAFANEHVSGIQLLALSVILLGVLFVNIPRYKSRQE